MNSASATSRLVCPSATRRRDLHLGRRELERRGRPPTDPRALGGHPLDPQRSSELREDVGRLVEGIACEALLLRPPSDLTEDEQRSSPFERLAHAFVLLEGAIDVDLSSVEVATRCGEQAPAPRGGCARPRPIDRAALLFQTVDQRLRGPELPERDQRLGLVRHARDDGGLDGSHLFQVANDRREMLVGSFMIGERQLEEPQHGPVPVRIEQVVVRDGEPNAVFRHLPAPPPPARGGPPRTPG